MKQQLLTYFCLIIMGLCPAKALNIDTLFINTPRHIMPLLDQTAKMDLVDLYNGGLQARVVNLFGGETFMLKKTDTFLSLKTTGSGTWTVKLLPYHNGDTLIVCAHSVKAGGISTELHTYTKDWTYKKVQIPVLKREALISLPQTSLPSEQQPLVATLQHLPVEVTVNDSTQQLSCRLNEEGLTADARQICKDWLVTVVYEWNGNGFVLKKDEQ